MQRVFSIVVLAVMWASPAAGQLKPGSPVFVVNLVNPNDPKTSVVSATSFNDALKRDGDQREPLSRIVDACTNPASEDDIVDHLDQCSDCLRAYQEKRYITERGDQTLLIVLFNASASGEGIRPVFQETPRDSELVASAKALRKLVDVGRESRGVACRAFHYTLQRKRSFLKVIVPVPRPLHDLQRQLEVKVADAARAGQPVAVPPAAPADKLAASKQKLVGAAAGPPDAAADADAPPADRIETPEVTLGPTERWVFSADFSFSEASVTLGSTPTPEEEALKSKDFFVALNFAVSDLLADRESPLQRRAFWKELLIKFQVTPSSEPWEAWAVGLGVRGYRIRTILWNMDVAHPYVTVGRQATDTGESRWRAVVGLGFDPRAIGKN